MPQIGVHRGFRERLELARRADPLGEREERVDDVADAKTHERVERTREAREERALEHRRRLLVEVLEQSLDSAKPQAAEPLRALHIRGFVVARPRHASEGLGGLAKVAVDEMKQRAQAAEAQRRVRRLPARSAGRGGTLAAHDPLGEPLADPVEGILDRPNLLAAAPELQQIGDDVPFEQARRQVA